MPKGKGRISDYMQGVGAWIYKRNDCMNYKNKKWIRKREVILKRDDYLCRECKRYGKRIPAEQVHHIYPVENYPEHKWNSVNLISLCTSCHDKMHDRVTRQLTALGLKWVERIKERVAS